MEYQNELFEEFQELLGTGTAHKVIDYYEGTSLYIPKSIGITKRNHEIRDAFKNGASYRELARQYNFTERHIRRIIHETTL